ncbi:hypothetical protein SSCG_03142 [Streptomyces clavuligerus]|nr:hypothetical protein SSCG_03142 [Streptomyces clavuligerus]
MIWINKQKKQKKRTIKKKKLAFCCQKKQIKKKKDKRPPVPAARTAPPYGPRAAARAIGRIPRVRSGRTAGRPAPGIDGRRTALLLTGSHKGDRSDARRGPPRVPSFRNKCKDGSSAGQGPDLRADETSAAHQPKGRTPLGEGTPATGAHAWRT